MVSKSSKWQSHIIVSERIFHLLIGETTFDIRLIIQGVFYCKDNPFGIQRVPSYHSNFRPINLVNLII